MLKQLHFGWKALYKKKIHKKYPRPNLKVFQQQIWISVTSLEK